MLDISTEFKNEIFNDRREYLPFVDITLKNGAVLNLKKEDIWEKSFKVEDATSVSGTFTIGAAVTGKFSVTLNNIYDKFSAYDFADASVVAYVGMQLSNTLEKVRVGTYTIDDPSYDGSTISLSCLDNMAKFDKEYSKSSLQYPARLSEILSDACSCCGVALITANFPNKGYVVNERPKDDALTFGDIVAMVAQIAGCWAKMDANGRLKLGWYDMSVFEKNANLDGGTFSTRTTPYSDGNSADGGNFTDYSSGDSFDGGTFQDQKAYHHIYGTKSFSVSTDDVVITGVKVTEEFEETEQEKRGTYLAGAEGYVIEVSGNSLIQKGKATEVATYLYGRVGGMTFRPFSVTTLSNPSIEAGDVAYVTDRKQNTYQTFISTRTFTLRGGETLSCDAETPSRNSAKRFSEMTKAVAKSKAEAEKQISAYDLAVQQLTNLMTQSFGVFKSEETLEDGSTIYYMHNKKNRSDSSTIWKMTADAFAVSTDGGKTWNAGLDSSGNAVVNILSAVGINFDWAHGGTLTLGGKSNGNGILRVVDENGNTVGRWDKDGITLPDNTVIKWSQVTETDNVATKNYVTTRGYETADSIKNTVITKDYIETLDIRAGSVAAENVTGTTFKGKTFQGGKVISSVIKNESDTWKIDENGNISGGSINIGSGNFTVDSSGKLISKSAEIEGKITATSGKIGGMKIYKSETSGSYYLETDPAYGLTTGIGNDGKWCFWSGWNGSEATLWITQEGKIHMRDWIYGTDEYSWATWTRKNDDWRYGLSYIYGDWSEADKVMYLRFVFHNHRDQSRPVGYCTLQLSNWEYGEPPITIN